MALASLEMHGEAAGAAVSLDRLRRLHGGRDGPALLAALLGPGGPLRHRTALVSAFGAESAVLLHMVAAVDPALPVIFLDTGRHFPETLAYRDQLVERLGLTDIRTAYPDAAELRRYDRQRAPVRGRSRLLLRHPQDAAAGPGARGLRRLDHRQEALPGRPQGDARRRSSARAGPAA